MRLLLTLLLCCCTLAWGAGVAAQTLGTAPAVTSEFSRARLLVHAPQGVQAGQPLWLGLEIHHAPDWHTYWKNPGDSGLPTELQWRLSPGVQAGEIAWPTPRKFPLGELANYGYDGTVLLPVPLRVGPDFQGPHLDVGLTASWLVCRKECVPEEAQFQLRVPAQGSVALDGAAFESAWAAAPQMLPANGSRLSAGARQLELQLEGLPQDWRGRPLELFPETPGLIEPGAPWQQAWRDGRWTASVPLSPHRSDSPQAVPLVVALAQPPGAGPGLPGVQLTLPVDGGWPAPAAAPTGGASEALTQALAENAARALPPTPNAVPLGLWAALLGALVGGMILNLMPCVFPVLAIKVLAFAQHGDNRRAHRLGGLAYTAGVVLSFLALGGLLLGLRAAGEQLGWGFQLQNPAVVAGLAVLFTLIGLNLAGLFEFGHLLPSSVASLQAKHPTADAFLTGVLATAIASPCTAPFMGASLGLAIALPTGQALAVFAALGLGMALPYLAASGWPALARALPRPGAWMETFRQLMAFPMFATVVWLLWVLGQQSGIDGAAALLMLLVALALLAWALNRGGRVRTVLGTLSVLGLAWLLWAVGPNVTRQQDGLLHSAPTAVAGLAWEAWSPQREAELLAAGRPVFVDYTAAWCVTCQYNKRNALADAGFLQDAASRQLALLRADWTRRDAVVTEALARLGRNGVPVYVLHAPGRPPVVLSEILSVDEVRSAVQQL
ncbi:protein-disulfide reductase DsbD [Aquabacterium sp. A08]|uniref:protein-disulfide reductase DsbD family protein n=1 Tax=Aquabacterium sp. A08 TaxID=2718532 RepID=UPI00141E156C|nr:protein-disulfide reductase DsbD domain-containing protein [Aquabacterium sp. A08]NIC43017.1 protein-disulfide reductase [Aquabacterium sp. A08]